MPKQRVLELTAQNTINETQRTVEYGSVVGKDGHSKWVLAPGLVFPIFSKTVKDGKFYVNPSKESVLVTSQLDFMPLDLTVPALQVEGVTNEFVKALGEQAGAQGMLNVEKKNQGQTFATSLSVLVLSAGALILLLIFSALWQADKLHFSL